MRTPLDRVTEDRVPTSIRAEWRLTLDEFVDFPEGAGAYHWLARSDDGTRWFVTCDDLDTKPWFGAERSSVFVRLLAAYGTALSLRAGGASFVVAPTPSLAGDAAVRIDDRYSVSVFEHVDGTPGRWGEPISPETHVELVEVLASLHAAAPDASRLITRGLRVPDRDALDDALDALDRPWDGGPLSEDLRHTLASNVDTVHTALADLDRCAERFEASGPGAVVTHGEPHPGNLIHTSAGLALVDWDTVAMARPERDLWMLAETDPTAVTRYRDLTGVSLDRDLLAGFRLLWAVTDITMFTVQLRGDHERTEDNERALMGLRSILASGGPRPYG